MIQSGQILYSLIDTWLFGARQISFMERKSLTPIQSAICYSIGAEMDGSGFAISTGLCKLEAI